MATILIIGGPQKGEWYHVTETRSLILGRDEELLAELKDRRVSYHHVEIGYDFTQDRYFADDLNSRNGVKINGQRITHRYFFNDEDIICIGKTYLAFLEVDLDEASEAKEKMLAMRTHAESMHRERPSARQSESGSQGGGGFFAARR